MISKIFLLIGILCLGLYGFFKVEAHVRQAQLEAELDQETSFVAVPPEPAGHTLQVGDLFGRLEVPRLGMSVMVMEGDTDSVLRQGAGRIRWADLAIAGHRDSFFRPLKDVEIGDEIRLTTPQGISEYHVVSTSVVEPDDTSAVKNAAPGNLTLVTCYPFQYIGPAPERFVVEASPN
jgi:LPXTG-site transpeptidase (sortase) family protein